MAALLRSLAASCTVVANPALGWRVCLLRGKAAAEMSAGDGDVNGQDQAILDEVLDRVTDELLEDDLPAFGGERQLRGLLFGQVSRFGRRWRRASNCVYPGCAEQSIRASHTIQESALRLIAENSTLLTPSFDLGRGCPVMQEVGVGEASTFPGFCERHEMVFAEFEQNGGIRSGRDAELQLFRIVCRELVAKRREVEYFGSIIATQERMLHAHLLDRIRAHVDANFIARNPNLQITATNMVSGWIEHFKKVLQEKAGDMTFIETELYPQAAKVLDGSDSGLVWVRMTVVPRLPVALAGLAGFHVARHGVPDHVQLVVQAIPKIDGTEIIAAGRFAQQDCFGVLLESKPPKPERMLALLEGWMIYGTDHWFVAPRFWNSLPPDRQEGFARKLKRFPKKAAVRRQKQVPSGSLSQKR
jgi:hypothetical protein